MQILAAGGQAPPNPKAREARAGTRGAQDETRRERLPPLSRHTPRQGPPSRQGHGVARSPPAPRRDGPGRGRLSAEGGGRAGGRPKFTAPRAPQHGLRAAAGWRAGQALPLPPLRRSHPARLGPTPEPEPEPDRARRQASARRRTGASAYRASERAGEHAGEHTIHSPPGRAPKGKQTAERSGAR